MTTPTGQAGIEAELDRFFPGQPEARRAAAAALEGGWWRGRFGAELRSEEVLEVIVLVKNYLHEKLEAAENEFRSS